MGGLEIALAAFPFAVLACLIGFSCAALHNAQLYGDENTIRVGARGILPLILGTIASYTLVEILPADPEKCGATPDSVVLVFFGIALPVAALAISLWKSS